MPEIESKEKRDGTIIQWTTEDKDEKFDKIILTYPNVVGWDRGLKIKKGKLTDAIAFRVFVEKKLPLKELRNKAIIPQTIDNLPTDVIETGEFRIPPIKKEGSLQALRGEDERKSRRRPFKGGVSMGNITGPTGSCGNIFLQDGKYVIHTNVHVGSEDPRLGLSQQSTRNCQPGPHDGDIQEDDMGDMTRMILLEEDYPAFNDSCIVSPDNPEDVSPEVLGLGVPEGVCTVSVGDEVRKSGRTTSVTQGTVLSTNATVRVNYGGYYITHKRCILVSDMSDGGDSGSTMWKLKDIWGYLFAGSNTHTVCHNIQNIMSVYNLSLPVEEEEPDEPLFSRAFLFLGYVIRVIISKAKT